MSTVFEQLQELKKNIEAKKTELARYEGEKTAIEAEFMKLGVTADTVEGRINELDADIANNTDQLTKLAARIRGLLDGSIQPTCETGASAPAVADAGSAGRRRRTQG